MTLSDSATAQLWETFRAGGGAGLIREAVELVLQELIEAEATEAIGAGRYERSDMRVTERNGHRSRLLATQAGDVELKIPQAAQGQLLPVDARAAPAHRPRPVGGGDGGLCGPGCRRGRWMTWWPLWARSPASRALRCRASARGLDEGRGGVPHPPVGPTSSSPTSTWTPPTSMCATACPSPRRWPPSWPPGSPQTATARCWAATSATARARGSGSSSWARCATGASPVCSW